MATTTTNFGWDIPQSTDLVKDGATAIATLGQDIDTAFVDLKGGTTGQVLSKASGTDLDFTWGTVAGGGKLLQVVQATTTTQTSTNGQTYIDSTLTATITPSATTSKIIIMTYQSISLIRGTVSDANGNVNLVRDSTEIIAAANPNIEYNNDSNHRWPFSINYMDSPSTTSATTYKTQIKSGSTSHTIYAQPNSLVSVMILMEIGA